MMKFAITGNIASGKSLAFDIIKNAGFPVIDADDIVNDLYSDAVFISKLVKVFPEVVINNSVDKNKIFKYFVTDNLKKASYENFLFPYVIEKINLFFKSNIDRSKVFVVVPLLYEAKMENMFDKVILIVAENSVRRDRLEKRNTFLSDKFNLIINSQMSQEDKIKKADYILENNCSKDDFKKIVENFIHEIK